MDEKILNKLNVFLKGYENFKDVIGVLVCGSYVTGNPNAHSDLDVHLILKENVGYRERGNRIVDGLLIEYFANSEKQILAYFDSDYKKVAPMSQIQFITGQIILDKDGAVQRLKDIAKAQLDKNYADVVSSPSPITLYSIWDMLDDLHAIFEENKDEFDFVYYNKLDTLLTIYFKINKIPYNTKTVVGHLTSSVTRGKYLLKEIKDEKFVDLVLDAVIGKSRKIRLDAFTAIAQEILDKYNFNIDSFTFKSEECF